MARLIAPLTVGAGIVALAHVGLRTALAIASAPSMGAF